VEDVAFAGPWEKQTSETERAGMRRAAPVRHVSATRSYGTVGSEVLMRSAHNLHNLAYTQPLMIPWGYSEIEDVDQRSCCYSCCGACSGAKQTWK
ncbi:unnamed protein product, partial [Pylaiella littoralis]